MSNEKPTNRLIHEASPYLLQHAHNPVDWYPWGEEAFDKAKKEDKPIFLSIGYSTCHWCHVMAHESFESEEVAKILKSGFVSIKVDREERPDIDEVYMNVCQAMTGSGGWPLTVIMTPKKIPFFAATYLPKDTMYGRTGLIELLLKIVVLWKENREALIKNGAEIQSFFTRTEEAPDGAVSEKKVIENGYTGIRNAFDEAYGGFSQSPKFPTPHYLLFLLGWWKAHKQPRALEMAEQTLEHMYRGGIFDHVGYGFSRYSTDEKWLVPHFEKMLYDNAMLLLAYSECYAVTHKNIYQNVAQKICTYVLRDMQSPQGGFYSAEDADSEGEEGKYYVWDYRELKNLLAEDELLLLEARYGVTMRGNFEGKNILNMIDAHGDGGALEASVLQKLYTARKKRVPPFKDTKISASWNGLMIEALARTGVVLEDRAYIESAERAARFVLAEIIDEDGALSSVYKDGKRSAKGFLADYANMTNALIALYTATRDLHYLNRAKVLAEEIIRRFWDAREDRFYMAGEGGEELFMRPRDAYDGAMPSGNASAITCLLRLYNATGSDDIARIMDRAIHAFLPMAAASPTAHVHILSAVLLRTRPHRQIVIAAEQANAEAIKAYETIIRQYLPFTNVIFYDRSAEMDAAIPALAGYKSEEHVFAAYVCEDFACKAPAHSTAELFHELGLPNGFREIKKGDSFPLGNADM